MSWGIRWTLTGSQARFNAGHRPDALRPNFSFLNQRFLFLPPHIWPFRHDWIFLPGTNSWLFICVIKCVICREILTCWGGRFKEVVQAGMSNKADDVRLVGAQVTSHLVLTLCHMHHVEEMTASLSYYIIDWHHPDPGMEEEEIIIRRSSINKCIR